MDPNGLQLWDLLSNAGIVGLVVLALVALARKWVILPRELEEPEKRIAMLQDRITELKKERDDLRGLLYQAVNIGEKIAGAIESGDRR